MEHKSIVVLYHKKCPDGFGAAYAAWKKYGDMAEYIPVGFGDSMQPGLEGREVFLLDFCYELPGEIERLRRVTKRLVILDHHVSARTRVESVPEHVFDDTRSGATIAWGYFHPHTPTPYLLQCLEDGDLYRYLLPETRQIYSYLIVQPDNFKTWDKVVERFESAKSRESILKKADDATRFFEAFANVSVEAAKKVRFEGYDCYFTTTLPSITMRSYVAHELYNKLPPIALVVTAHPDGFGVSIRGDGSVDVSKIAAKFNGGGHANSAGFFIRNGATMPWAEIED